VKGVKASAKSLEEIGTYAAELHALRAKLKPFMDDPNTKKLRREVDRAVSKHLLQISATNNQVRQKTADMLQLLRGLHEPQQSYCLLQICNKALLQCESQVCTRDCEPRRPNVKLIGWCQSVRPWSSFLGAADSCPCVVEAANRVVQLVSNLGVSGWVVWGGVPRCASCRHSRSRSPR
jgi:hypothetical protein